MPNERDKCFLARPRCHGIVDGRIVLPALLAIDARPLLSPFFDRLCHRRRGSRRAGVYCVLERTRTAFLSDTFARLHSHIDRDNRQESGEPQRPVEPRPTNRTCEFIDLDQYQRQGGRAVLIGVLREFGNATEIAPVYLRQVPPTVFSSDSLRQCCQLRSGIPRELTVVTGTLRWRRVTSRTMSRDNSLPHRGYGIGNTISSHSSCSATSSIWNTISPSR